MSDDKKKNVYFHCQPCKVVWLADDDSYVTVGESLQAVCPVCEKHDGVIHCSWRVFNLYKGWGMATGPRTEEGKRRASLNNWKHGRFASQLHIIAPAKPEKLPACSSCTIVEKCKSQKFKYCPVDLETIALFIQAYQEGKVNDLKDIAGMNQAQVQKILQNMVHHIMENGVYLTTKIPVLDDDKRPVKDDDGNIIYITRHEKNNLLKDIPSFINTLGFSAEQQDMTPAKRQESETLKGHLQDRKEERQSLLQVQKEAHDERIRMRQAIEKMNASAKLKKFNEQTTDSLGEPGGDGDKAL